MSNQINVGFKVTGAELSQYIDNITKKSEKQAQDAIKSALAQNAAGKEQLEIINKTITALEKKTRLEGQAARSILNEQREAALRANAAKFDQIRAEIGDRAKKGIITYDEARAGIDQTRSQQSAGSAQIRSEYRDNLTTVKETERQSKLQTQLSKETIETLKQTANANVKAIQSGDKSLESVIANASTDEEKLVAKLTQEGLLKEKKDRPGGGGGGSVLGGILSAENLNKILATGAQFAQTQNGFDMIQTGANTFGRIVGGVIGGVIGSFIEPGGGTLVGAGVGASIGGNFGDAIGAFEQRRAISKEEFFKARNRFNAITGRDDVSGFDTEVIGVGATQFVQQQSEYARRRGRSAGSGKTLLDALYAEKGVGVDQGTSGGLIEIQRSQKENNRDLAALIGGVLQKGSNSFFKNGDTTFLNEFLGRFTQLQKELLKTNATMATGGTYDILSRFNSLGGEFSTSDPRSSGIINTINSSLANPSSDMKKALSFYALKKNNPNMSLADLIEEQQKGLGSSNYLNSMMGLVDGMGGDESAKRLNFAGMLGLEGNQKWASDVYSGYKSGKFKGGFAGGELSGLYDFKGRAEENTTTMERNSASISNGLLQDRLATAEALASAVSDAIIATMSGAVITLDNGTLTFASRVTIQQNATRAAADKKKADSAPSWQMRDVLAAQKNGGTHHK